MRVWSPYAAKGVGVCIVAGDGRGIQKIEGVLGCHSGSFDNDAAQIQYGGVSESFCLEGSVGGLELFNRCLKLELELGLSERGWRDNPNTHSTVGIDALWMACPDFLSFAGSPSYPKEERAGSNDAASKHGLQQVRRACLPEYLQG